MVIALGSANTRKKANLHRRSKRYSSKDECRSHCRSTHTGAIGLSDYNNELIRLDVKQPTEKSMGMTQALLVEKEKWYAVNDNNTKTLLLLNDNMNALKEINTSAAFSPTNS